MLDGRGGKVVGLVPPPHRDRNVSRDAKHGAALRHLPSGHAHVIRAWMWGALIATSLGGWLHHLTAIPGPDAAHRPAPLLGPGIRDGKAMIAILRHRLIRVPGRVIHHAGQLTLRLPPHSSASQRDPRLPQSSLHSALTRPHRPQPPWNPPTRGAQPARDPQNTPRRSSIATGRTAAIRQHVLDMPTPVIADALNYHAVTTVKIATQAGVTWSRYAIGDHKNRRQLNTRAHQSRRPIGGRVPELRG
jgi:hypothetical protein